MRAMTRTPPVSPASPAALLNHRGFTLVEVLVALFLLSVGLIALLATNRLALRTETATTMGTAALATAEDRLSLLLAADTSELTDGSATDARCKAPVIENGLVINTVQCSYTPSAVSRIDVTVSVREPLASNPVHLQGSRYVP